MNIQEIVNPTDYEVGCIIARFQVHELHKAHVELIDLVCNNHKKVIIFLGVSKISDTRRNPLDFATRKSMIQELYPNIVILPLADQRYDTVWSNTLDNLISVPYGAKKTLLYGSRDSFLPHYKGRHATTELVSSVYYSGTEVRNRVSKEILDSKDFRAGIIHSAYAQRPVTYPTVDICAYNDKGQILLAKKPNETHWRFVGGFVDRDDTCYEKAAKREFSEETGGCNLSSLTYITSQNIHDWRYKNEDSGIMTTLFLGEFGFGKIEPTDDISELAWIDANKFTSLQYISKNVMPEHVTLMITLMEKVYKEKLIPNLGPFYTQRVEPVDPDIVVRDTTFNVK
jgi:bifunctional NMN adenylyltransferase/nudix hydrolase